MSRLCVEETRNFGEDSCTRQSKRKNTSKKTTTALGVLCQENYCRFLIGY